MSKVRNLLFAVVVFIFILGTITIAGCSRPTAQDEYASMSIRVDKVFSKWDEADSPGAAVVVVKDGEVVHKGGYGMANLEYGAPITPSTMFEVGSVAKQFTAMAIALLAAQGKISLDDDIHTYVPEVPDFGKPITIRHLIHHMSGLRNWEVLFILEGNLGKITTKRVLQMIRHQKELNFDPGEEYSYCNAGYVLLAEVVQRVTGQSFRGWTRANIFEPLGMTNTSFYDDYTRIVKNRAYGYMPKGKGGFRNVLYTSAAPGPASLFTTAEDLSEWIKNFEEKRVGGPAVIEQMLERGLLNNGTKLDYAFGLEVGEYRGLKRIYHVGGWAGFGSVLVHFPEQRFGVVVLSNLGLGAFDPVPLAHQITDIYLGDHLTSVEKTKRKALKLKPAIYEGYVGEFVMHVPYSDAKLVAITLESGRLMGEVQGEWKVKLVPESETRFFLKGEDTQLTFLQDGRGKANEITIRSHGWQLPLPARRLQTLSPDKLIEFTGDCYSEELGTTWSVILHKGRLITRHRWQADVRLFPTGTDRFSGNKWWFQEILFTRDSEGNIAGFRVSGEDGLVRNVRFDKLS